MILLTLLCCLFALGLFALAADVWKRSFDHPPRRHGPEWFSHWALMWIVVTLCSVLGVACLVGAVKCVLMYLEGP